MIIFSTLALIMIIILGIVITLVAFAGLYIACYIMLKLFKILFKEW